MANRVRGSSDSRMLSFLSRCLGDCDGGSGTKARSLSVLATSLVGALGQHSLVQR